jgi:hypothetical protein
VNLPWNSFVSICELCLSVQIIPKDANGDPCFFLQTLFRLPIDGVLLLDKGVCCPVNTSEGSRTLSSTCIHFNIYIIHGNIAIRLIFMETPAIPEITVPVLVGPRHFLSSPFLQRFSKIVEYAGRCLWMHPWTLC